MGTKENPGKYDCYEKAEPDEPMFVLLGRDVFAPRAVRAWASMAMSAGVDREKIEEAMALADAMDEYRRRPKEQEGVTQFTCPKCKSHFFGSILNPKDNTVCQRICHGMCWQPRHEHDISEDYKYFTLDGKSYPSEETYEAAVLAIKPHEVTVGMVPE